MRRFLLHTLPSGLHRIRHYGLLANGNRKTCLASARELLGQALELPVMPDDADANRSAPSFVCRHCGATLIIVQTFTRIHTIRAPPQMAQPP